MTPSAFAVEATEDGSAPSALRTTTSYELFFSLASSPQSARVLYRERSDDTARAHWLLWCLGFSSPEGTKERRFAISIREDIIMLDKAPNGKVSDLLNALDQALSSGEVEQAVDLFQTDCYWRDLV